MLLVAGMARTPVRPSGRLPPRNRQRTNEPSTFPTSGGHGVRGAWGQTEFQVNLKLGLTPRRREPIFVERDTVPTSPITKSFS